MLGIVLNHPVKSRQFLWFIFWSKFSTGDEGISYMRSNHQILFQVICIQNKIIVSLFFHQGMSIIIIGQIHSFSIVYKNIDPHQGMYYMTGVKFYFFIGSRLPQPVTEVITVTHFMHNNLMTLSFQSLGGIYGYGSLTRTDMTTYN